MACLRRFDIDALPDWPGGQESGQSINCDQRFLAPGLVAWIAQVRIADPTLHIVEFCTRRLINLDEADLTVSRDIPLLFNSGRTAESTSCRTNVRLRHVIPNLETPRIDNDDDHTVAQTARSFPKLADATRPRRFEKRGEYANDARSDGPDAGAQRFAYPAGLLARCESLAGDRGRSACLVDNDDRALRDAAASFGHGSPRLTIDSRSAI